MIPKISTSGTLMRNAARQETNCEEAGPRRSAEGCNRPHHGLHAENLGHQAAGEKLGDQRKADRRHDALPEALHGAADQHLGHGRCIGGQERARQEHHRRRQQRRARAQPLLEERGTRTADDGEHQIEGRRPRDHRDAIQLLHGRRKRRVGEERIEGEQGHAKAQDHSDGDIARPEDFGPTALNGIGHLADS
jgi:hypothetical protein